MKVHISSVVKDVFAGVDITRQYTAGGCGYLVARLYVTMQGETVDISNIELDATTRSINREYNIFCDAMRVVNIIRDYTSYSLNYYKVEDAIRRVGKYEEKLYLDGVVKVL